jgi:hypothetical protein
MDYQRIAAEILFRIGGAENIASVAQCAARRRRVLPSKPAIGNAFSCTWMPGMGQRNPYRV